MNVFKYQGKTYDVDSEGFLWEFSQWDEDFAEGMASSVNIHEGLTRRHWLVINYIRDTFGESGKCPLVYQTCQSNMLYLRDLKDLFPTGYLRGACKLAGITYKQGYLPLTLLAETGKAVSSAEEKTYKINAQGFLVDPLEWDERFSLCKAHEMKMDELTDEHWQVINFLRNNYKKNGVVPSIYETCEANNLDIENLERLFPDGYHRGAVKIAGLCVR